MKGLTRLPPSFSMLTEHASDGLCIQVASTIIGTAVTGVIKNAQESLGTPNRFLQTYLDTAPTLTITPDTLDPVVLFAGKIWSPSATF